MSYFSPQLTFVVFERHNRSIKAANCEISQIADYQNSFGDVFNYIYFSESYAGMVKKPY